jgi:hypothetical protein
MRKTVITLLALGLVVASTAFASNAVRISQAYGGGGNSGAYYRYDYVELFNSSNAPVSIGGWSIQYAASTSTSFGATGAPPNAFYVQFPANATIPACGYYLIQLASGANTNAANLPTPDAIGTIAVGSGAFKIGLASSGTSQVCPGTWVDLATFNSTQCFETTTGPVLGNTLAGVRGGAGMTDNDNNSTDFAAVTCDASLVIHNSSSPANPNCVPPTPTGACCLRNLAPGACIITTQADCLQRPGIYLGDNMPCDPGICATPTTKTTWGQVKTLYR